MKCFRMPPQHCFDILPVPFVKPGVGLFLYGVYTVLYTLCIYILATRKRNRYWVHVMSITALYTAATVEVGLKLTLYTADARYNLIKYTNHLPLSEDPWNELRDEVLVFSSLGVQWSFADSLDL
ncbi:hypothetical protein PM082_018477 [Marasmius tenuissimus]|nr:hypothetical protein PM082_018477 [Marasmius tenuissimus]